MRTESNDEILNLRGCLLAREREIDALKQMIVMIVHSCGEIRLSAEAQRMGGIGIMVHRDEELSTGDIYFRAYEQVPPTEGEK